MGKDISFSLDFLPLMKLGAASSLREASSYRPGSKTKYKTKTGSAVSRLFPAALVHW